ncbi:MAG: DUF108 domain-containing protein, partial [Clostridiales bacterium]|nr:DUF108 domain-containing protein [Clostridiales bacterium]
LEDLLTADIDLVIEAANPAVVKASAKAVLAAGKDFLTMSVGGLIEPGFLAELETVAAASGANLYLPAGAMTGQNVAAASLPVGLDEVVIQSTKNPAGLREAPYIKEKGIDLDAIEEPTVIFRGNVFDAVKYFPQNVNIAASLALAGPGPDKTMVEIVADPKSTVTLHIARMKGAFGEMECRMQLVPSPNKRSSYLATLGAIAAVKKYCSPIKMGY